jgi:hypothetical protein
MPNLGNEATVSGTDVWLTPPHILEALGEFDLDPCSSEDRPWDTAKTHYTIKDDGLMQPWFGRVWCNPPYGPKMAPFLSKLAAHDGGGVALIFARTETKAFFDHVWDKATAILFIKGRLKFHKPNGELGGTAGSPSVLIAYGEADAEILKNCNIKGKYIRIR